MKTRLSVIRTSLGLLLYLCHLALGVIDGSPHDLSAIGGQNPCTFCHTPHGALTGTPLWNHKLSSTVYKIYQSSSLDAQVGQPTGASKLCLSCHDGTVALTETVSGSAGIDTYISPGVANLGSDLSDDHPVSFVYSAALSTEDVQLRSPYSLSAELKLDRDSELQCTTCHDPHDNQYGDFLVMSNNRSGMCLGCHDLMGWPNSSHEMSNASILSANDPYLNSQGYGMVAEAACLSCHRPHSAAGSERLLHSSNSEDNCLNCHDGSVARTNIRNDLARFSRHDVTRYDGVHDLTETSISMDMHVECVDCHNPHSVRAASVQAPVAAGAIRGVSGLTASGTPVTPIQYEYELCYKCHGDNPNRVPSQITRQITQTNTRLEFDLTNPSFHPVVAAGVNMNVPSLIQPRTVSSVIYCTDCHNSSRGSSLKGPHGSIYSPLLAYNYETDDFTTESVFAYALCYRCHSRNSILNDESFPKHEEHLEEGIPCAACHDAHGISSGQGSASNHSHLINFDTSIVAADPVTGRLEFNDLGEERGQCFLTCHGKDHAPLGY